MNYFSLEIRELSIRKRTSFQRKDFLRDKREVILKTSVTLCSVLIWLNLPLRAHQVVELMLLFPFKIIFCHFNLMEKPSGILETKCPGAYLFLEGNGPQHIHSTKKKKKVASHGSAYWSSEQYLRGRKDKLLSNEWVAPTYIFPPGKTHDWVYWTYRISANTKYTGRKNRTSPQAVGLSLGTNEWIASILISKTYDMHDDFFALFFYFFSHWMRSSLNEVESPLWPNYNNNQSNWVLTLCQVLL